MTTAERDGVDPNPEIDGVIGISFLFEHHIFSMLKLEMAASTDSSRDIDDCNLLTSTYGHR